jgi:uncharacterized NAD(P)/FAD-binding protein YdhS
MSSGRAARRFAVVGGGYSAAAFIIHAIRRLAGKLDFDVIDPAPELGRGIAYSTRDPLHRINVPSDRMSLLPDDGEHATRWLFAQSLLPGDGSGADGTGAWYVPRWHYGTYVGSILSETVRAAGNRVSLRHHRRRATDAARGEGGWTVDLDDGQVVASDDLVLAFGHAVPGLPFPVSPAARDHPGFVTDPWRDGALSSIEPRSDVLIVGTGLTMADVVETLLARGHQGDLVAVSRRGLLPQPQGQFRSDVPFLRGAARPTTARALLRLARLRAREADAAGLGWQVAADALRFQLGEIWPPLPPAEKATVVRRLLPFWDTHRFRIAPQPDRTLRNALRTGQIVVEKGRMLELDRSGQRLSATLRLGSRLSRLTVDAVALCVGPGRDPMANPLIRRLVTRGIARLDTLGSGLDVTSDSRLIGATGVVQPSALALGPMTRGTFGEMTGAPDIVRHIEHLVEGLAEVGQTNVLS